MADTTGEYRVLSLDGGGIKGVFAAAILADFEEALGAPLASHFDLVAGTSTGGIIALGLGLGVPASEILRFYEQHGPEIFKAGRGLFGRLSSAKYDVESLRRALVEVFADRRLGEANTRLIIPSTNLETGEVHVFKTAHHQRFTHDHKCKVVDVALATAAAPTFFPLHRLLAGMPLIDGGLWANNPMGPAAVEALGVLDWPRGSVKLLSISCPDSAPTIRSPKAPGPGFTSAPHLLRTFMNAQSSASTGTANLLLGHDNVYRISRAVAGKRFKLDDAAEIEALKGLGAEVARAEYPKVSSMFLRNKAQPFVPLHGGTQ